MTSSRHNGVQTFSSTANLTLTCINCSIFSHIYIYIYVGNGFTLILHYVIYKGLAYLCGIILPIEIK